LELTFHIGPMEKRIMPDMSPGLLGYEGHPGNQGGHPGNLGNPQSHSALPKVPAGATPQSNP